eukprot:EG_transcript_31011
MPIPLASDHRPGPLGSRQPTGGPAGPVGLRHSAAARSPSPGPAGRPSAGTPVRRPTTAQPSLGRKAGSRGPESRTQQNPVVAAVKAVVHTPLIVTSHVGRHASASGPEAGGPLAVISHLDARRRSVSPGGSCPSCGSVSPSFGSSGCTPRTDSSDSPGFAEAAANAAAHLGDPRVAVLLPPGPPAPRGPHLNPHPH